MSILTAVLSQVPDSPAPSAAEKLEIGGPAHSAAEALKSPDEWKQTSGRTWFEGELAKAVAQRAGRAGGDGRVHMDADRLGSFGEARARRIWALPAAEFANHVTAPCLAIADALGRGLPVSAIAFDAYNAESARARRRPRFELPPGYARCGDCYVPAPAPRTQPRGNSLPYRKTGYVNQSSRQPRPRR